MRIGLLHVPVMDDAASEAVRGQLRRVSGVVVMQEGYAASQRHWIEATLVRWCDEEELDLVLTIGGTLPAPGPSSEEIVPEVSAGVIERRLDGLAQLMRTSAWDAYSLAMIDRGVVGIRGRTVIVNLPAGAHAASAFLAGIVDQIPLVFAYLRQDEAGTSHTPSTAATTGETPAEPAGAKPQAPRRTRRGKGLNADDFEAFLRRNQSEE